MPTTWLVRHARPIVDCGICYGHLDVAADPVATALVAQDLAGRVPAGWSLVSSPLRRCRQLAEAIARLRPALALSEDAALAEMNFGTWEGRSWQDIGAAAIDAWTRDFAHLAPGGGESVTTFMARVAAVLRSPVAGDRVWITHAGVMRAAELIAQGTSTIESATQWPSQPIGYGECLVLTTPPTNR
ncbi:histidine phosphatase family protein [Xylophilus sp. GOD-11R]|uniref:histidine phosphatase family protein n=1 Tax=Xylophilus sp. GOD-11R TaxID=3089814 RepID=UPI00298D33E4|nr:histidine phosphatase family protein [Xylophilus sp. GOD-11R]WPB57501.1 histidine phosphatase family protein [Xylophilus sp. GOD-11R]